MSSSILHRISVLANVLEFRTSVDQEGHYCSRAVLTEASVLGASDVTREAEVLLQLSLWRSGLPHSSLRAKLMHDWVVYGQSYHPVLEMSPTGRISRSYGSIGPASAATLLESWGRSIPQELDELSCQLGAETGRWSSGKPGPLTGANPSTSHQTSSVGPSYPYMNAGRDSLQSLCVKISSAPSR